MILIIYIRLIICIRHEGYKWHEFNILKKMLQTACLFNRKWCQVSLTGVDGSDWFEGIIKQSVWRFVNQKLVEYCFCWNWLILKEISFFVLASVLECHVLCLTRSTFYFYISYLNVIRIKDFNILNRIIKIPCGNGKNINEEFYLYTWWLL